MPDDRRVSIGDLIEVPELRTVVRLGDIDDDAEADSLAQSFVFTDDAVRVLRLLGRSFTEPTGQGFFLIGSYGSGKSHLLSVLSLWSEAGPAALAGQPVPAELADVAPLFPRPLMAVRCSLVEHRGAEALEECVLAAAERRLAGLGRDAPLTPARQHLARLRTALAPAERERLDEFLAERGLASLDELYQSQPQVAVAAARDFLREIAIDLPERLSDDRATLFARLLEEARAAGFAGILLLVDELSEFLRSKPSSRALSEDARFLQFLGETGRDLPLWTLASLQETLEETGDVARPVLDKIKDRYPVRLRLSTTHVEELVAERLVRKKPGANAILDELHEQLREHFPDLTLSRDRFRRLYPLHPKTLDYLEGLTDLFSQARGVVEFVTTQVRGDPLRDIPGLLTADAATLLGVDAIFDHFEPRIREHDSYAPYHRKAYQHLSKRVAELFPGDEERHLAQRLVRVLILTEINPLEGHKSVKELAELLLTKVSALDPSLNYRYLEEAVLAPLYEASDYLKRAVSDEPFGDRYSVDLALDVRSVLRQRTAARLKAARGDELRLLRQLLSELEGGVLPLAALSRGEPTTASVRWLNTDRAGELLLGEPADLGDRLTAALARLDDGELDYLVAVRELSAEPRPVPSSIDRSDVIVWTPEPLTESQLEMLVTAAVHRVLRAELGGKTEEEVRLLELLTEEIDKETARALKTIDELYLRGALTPARAQQAALPLAMPVTARSLEQALTPVVGRALGDAHPEFRRVMPQAEYVNPRTLAQALAELATAGSVGAAAARSKGILAVTEGVLAPLGLVRLKRGAYALVPDETPGSLVHSLLAELAGSDRLPYATVHHRLRKGAYGLPELLARAVVVGLVQSGHIIARRGGKAVATRYISFETVATLEELSLGQLIDHGTQQALRRLEFLFKEPLPEFWGLKTQRDVWRALVDFKTKTGERLEALREARARYGEVAGLAGFDWSQLEELTAPLNALAAAIHPSHDSRHGIETLIAAEAEIGLDGRSLAAVTAVERFFAGDADKLLFAHGYVRDAALDGIVEAALRGELLALRGELDRLTDLVLDGAVAALLERFERFRDAYREAYSRGHEREVSEGAFADLAAVADSREMRALAHLAPIEELSVANDHARLSRSVERALRRRCRKDPASALYTRPTCVCGYQLGESIARPAPGELKAHARDGIVEYAAVLHEPDRRARVLAHAAALEGTERQPAAESLRALIRSLDHGAEANELLLVIDRQLGSTLAEALAGRLTIVERDVTTLVDLIAARKLQPRRLRELFEEWLDGRGLTPETLIHVVEPAPAAGAASGAPDPAQRRRPRAPGEVLAVGLAAWAAARGLDAGEVARALQLLDVPAEPAPATALAELSSEVDELLERDPTRCRAIAELLGYAARSAPSLAADIQLEPALETVRGLALDRMTTLVLAREAEAGALPGLDARPLPLPTPGKRASVIELYGAIRHALEIAERSERDSRELLSGLLAFDAAATLGTRSGAIEPATARALLERARLLGRIASEPVATATESSNLLAAAPRGRCLFLVVDGLRFDLWLALRPLFESGLKRRVAIEELRHAPVPSTTEVGRARLLGLDDGEDPATALARLGVSYVSAGERDYNAQALAAAMAGSASERRVVWLNLLDDKIHSSTLSPWGLAEATAGEIAVSLRRYFEMVPSRDHVILTADHGFCDNPAWPRGKERYGHGGASLLERAVPFVVFA